MAKPKAASKPTRAIPVSWATLRGLLAKPVDDPAVKKVLAKAGKVRVDADYIVAKEAGFDYALDRPESAKRNTPKLLHTLFLFAEGADGHRGYRGLPEPFAFVARTELLAAAGKPESSFEIGEGDVDVDSPNVDRDTWKVDGVELSADYKRGVVRHFMASLPEDDMGGRDVSSSPLYHETEPVDAPPGAALVAMALMVAWAAERVGLPAKHAGTPLGKQLLERAITPRSFLEKACDRKLTSLDFAPELGDFLHGYTNRLYLGKKERDATARDIKKLLNLHRADERAYDDDFLGTFARVLKSPFYVPDSWEAVDRIAPVLDARWADYQKTKLKTAPDLALYVKAAAARDAVKITPAKKSVAQAPELDDGFAAELLALLERPLSDKAVQATLARAGLPIGKRIDEQANPVLGVSYLGSKTDVAGKRVLAVMDVTFYADKQKSYIRGLGKEVAFRGYPAKLPRGVALGDTRAAVRKAFGKPATSDEDRDYWYPSKTRRISAQFSNNDKLAYVSFGLPADWVDPPKPPFTGVGIF